MEREEGGGRRKARRGQTVAHEPSAALSNGTEGVGGRARETHAWVGLQICNWPRRRQGEGQNCRQAAQVRAEPFGYLCFTLEPCLTFRRMYLFIS